MDWVGNFPKTGHQISLTGFDSASTPLSASAQPTNSGTTRCLSGVEGNMGQARPHIKAAATQNSQI
ncbi:MAG: hypothetical protein KJ914_11560 [Gammaproteobacteria bacterium]|nr:hypothetical protein [Gammaproteobacteria bacterium]MBU1723520.1 hypothetical protein [Gammaproteobacteria bacterium]MBU2004078.1 hypothetical protein [Gammaproteobacteria bacterium]